MMIIAALIDSTDIGECQDVTLLDNSHHTPKIPKILTIVARRLVVMIGSDDGGESRAHVGSHMQEMEASLIESAGIHAGIRDLGGDN
jgi:hypothetical protein